MWPRKTRIEEGELTEERGAWTSQDMSRRLSYDVMYLLFVAAGVGEESGDMEHDFMTLKYCVH